MIIMLTTEIHFQLEDTPAQKSSLVFTGRDFKSSDIPTYLGLKRAPSSIIMLTIKISIAIFIV